MWEKILKIKNETAKDMPEKGISQNEVQNTSKASVELPEGIEFEEDDNEDEFDLI